MREKQENVGPGTGVARAQARLNIDLQASSAQIQASLYACAFHTSSLAVADCVIDSAAYQYADPVDTEQGGLMVGSRHDTDSPYQCRLDTCYVCSGRFGVRGYVCGIFWDAQHIPQGLDFARPSLGQCSQCKYIRSHAHGCVPVGKPACMPACDWEAVQPVGTV